MIFMHDILYKTTISSKIKFALYLVFLYYFCQRQAALGNRNEGTAYMRDAHPACTLNQRNILQTKWK